MCRALKQAKVVFGYHPLSHTLFKIPHMLWKDTEKILMHISQLT